MIWTTGQLRLRHLDNGPGDRTELWLRIGPAVSRREIFNHRFTCMYYTVYYRTYSLLTIYVSKFITAVSKNVNTVYSMHTQKLS